MAAASAATPQPAACPPPDRSGGRAYFPYLDSYRFLVILAIMVVGDLGSAGLEAWWNKSGVRTFFLLSGFFAALVLGRIQDSFTGRPSATVHTLIRYYVFRVLRIFPVYFAIVLACVVADIGPAREAWLFLLTFTQNFYPSATGESLWILSHFWSLAVLEQFYVLFPLAFIATRSHPRLQLTCAAAGVVAAFAYRGWAVARGVENHDWMLAAHLDAFALGVMLALVCAHATLAPLRARLEAVPAWLQVAGACAALAAFKTAATQGVLMVSDNTRWTVEILLIAALTLGLTRPLPTAADRALRHPWLCHLGVVSYGMYAFKGFADWIVSKPFILLGVDKPGHPGVLVALYVAFTVGAALLSWHLFERHILHLRAPAVAAVVAALRRARRMLTPGLRRADA